MSPDKQRVEHQQIVFAAAPVFRHVKAQAVRKVILSLLRTMAFVRRCSEKMLKGYVLGTAAFKRLWSDWYVKRIYEFIDHGDVGSDWPLRNLSTCLSSCSLCRQPQGDTANHIGHRKVARRLFSELSRPKGRKANDHFSRYLQRRLHAESMVSTRTCRYSRQGCCRSHSSIIPLFPILRAKH